ncbi:MAG TPA: hypothetical protein VM327_07355 [Candidatus Thermoplasmatota archaeon]|nr:hypothetical protein [Candidatus Thermoplasmatota archaeon]
MRIPVGAPAAILTVLLVAGCFGRGAEDDREGAMPVVGDGYALDCSIGSADWSEPCLAWSSRNDSPSKTEIDIAVSPVDPDTVFVASKDLDPAASSCVWAVGQVTHDGGKTWTTVYVGGTMDERTPTEPLFGWACITDPILQFSKDGALHYSLQAYNYRDIEGAYPPTPVGLPISPEGGNMYHATSFDGGDSFPSIKPMHAGDAGAIYHDYMRMATNPRTGTVFTLWNQITGGATVFPVLVAARTDGTVLPPVYFVAPDAPGDVGLNSIAGAPDGTVHALFTGVGLTPAGNAEQVFRAASDDDGMTFSLPERQFEFTPMQDIPDVEFRSGSSVELAVDTSGGAHGGCLYAVFPDGAADVGDIHARTSCDGGATWSDPVLVSNGPHEGAQFFPRVSVDGRGTAHVVYETQAYDPEHRLLDVEWARSSDGGASWTVQRLTQQHSDGDLGVHQDGFPFYGDYIGISSAGDHTYMGFPVTVTGKAEIAVAHIHHIGSDGESMGGHVH